jgi:multiple sugar transport system substrate-binding protein
VPVINGIAWDHPRGFDPMVATAKEFANRYPEVEILWDKRPLQAFADRPIENMAFEYDLMVIDHPHVGEASRKNLLLELDSFNEFKDKIDILSKNSVGLSYQSYNFNNHQYALAIDAATPVAAFKVGTLDELPFTFEQVLSLAEKSLVIWPIKPVDAISCFNTIAANIGHAINSTEHEFIDRGIGITILKMMKKLSSLVPKDCLEMNPINALDYMSSNNDKVYCPLLYGYSNYSRKNFRDGLIKFTNIPSFDENINNCKGAQIGGTGLAISKETKNIEIALEYVFWVASEECQKNSYYYLGGQPAHIEAWKDKNINNNCNNFFINTLKTLENAWLRPRFDGYMYFQDIAGTIINDYLKNDKQADITIDKIIMEFEKSLNVNQ